MEIREIAGANRANIFTRIVIDGEKGVLFNAVLDYIQKWMYRSTSTPKQSCMICCQPIKASLSWPLCDLALP